MAANRLEQVLETPKNSFWDEANWKLAERALVEHEHKFVFVDWGMGNQAISVTRGRSGRVFDVWPAFANIDSAIAQLRIYGTDARYCSRLPGYEAFPANRANFFEAASLVGRRVVQESFVVNERGVPIIEVVRIERIDP